MSHTTSPNLTEQQAFIVGLLNTYGLPYKKIVPFLVNVDVVASEDTLGNLHTYIYKTPPSCVLFIYALTFDVSNGHTFQVFDISLGFLQPAFQKLTNGKPIDWDMTQNYQTSSPSTMLIADSIVIQADNTTPVLNVAIQGWLVQV